MPRNIAEAVNEMLKNAGGTPTGGGGSIADKLNQIIVQRGGEAHYGTIEEKVREVASLSSSSPAIVGSSKVG